MLTLNTFAFHSCLTCVFVLPALTDFGKGNNFLIFVFVFVLLNFLRAVGALKYKNMTLKPQKHHVGKI